MSTTDDVLDAIDRAVEEYALSPDAMRWTHDVVPDAVVQGLRPRWIVVDEVAVSPHLLENVHDAIRPALARMVLELNASARAMREAGQSLEQLVTTWHGHLERQVQGAHIADLFGVPREVLGLPPRPEPVVRTPRPPRVRPPDRPVPLPHNHAGPPAGRIRGPRTIGRPHTARR